MNKTPFFPMKSLCLVVLLSILGSGPLGAASATWSGAIDGDWTNASNWASSVVGSASTSLNADTATFNNNVNTTITVDSTRYLGGMTFNAGAGAFTFNGGALYFAPSGTGGTATDILINSGVTTDQVFNSNINSYTTTTGTHVGFTNNGSGTLTINGGITGNTGTANPTALNLDGSGNGTINGVIANGGANVLNLTKYGQGTWTLAGANTYTGATNLYDGELKLDFAGSSSPLSNIASSTGTLLLGRPSPGLTGSRTLTIAGKADTANTQTFNGYSVNIGANHLNLTTSGTGTMTVNLGLIASGTGRTAGTSLDISAPAGTTVTTTTATNTAGLLYGGVILNGTDWASKNGSNNVIAATYTANTATTLGSGLASVVDMSADNTALTGTGTTTINALRFNNAAATTITLDPGRVLYAGGAGGAGGILTTANVGAHTSTITGGIIAGLQGRDLLIFQNNTSGNLVLDSVLTSANTAGANTFMGLTKSGMGTLVLSGKNTFGGSTNYIHEGKVVVTTDPTAASTQILTLASNSTTLTGVDTTGLFIGQRVTGYNGFTNLGSYITAIDSGAGTVTLASTATAGTNMSVTFSNSGGLGIQTGATAVQIAYGATLQIGNGGSAGGLAAGQGVTNYGTVDFNRNNDMSFSNYIYGPGSVAQSGTGATTLPATQFYTGNTVVNDGALVINGDSVAAQSNVSGTRTQTSTVITDMSPAVLANLRVGQPISGSGISPGATIVAIDTGANTITMSAAATSNNTSSNLVFTVGSGAGTGAVSVTGGTLLVNSGGNINGASGVSVTGGTFRYDGTTALDRNVTLNGGKFSYNSVNNYAGTLTFTSGTIGGSNLSNLSLSIGTGQKMSPGNSTGTMTAGATTWATGGTFLFELNDTTGTAGSTSLGWDLLNAASLDITAGTGEFTIQIASLDSLQAAGSALNFDGTSNYTWLFVDAGATITGFNSGKFIFDETGFVNSTPGTFSISQGTGVDDDKLYLNYTGVIPEPGTYAMLVGGLGLLALLRRLSRK